MSRVTYVHNLQEIGSILICMAMMRLLFLKPHFGFLEKLNDEYSCACLAIILEFVRAWKIQSEQPWAILLLWGSNGPNFEGSVKHSFCTKTLQIQQLISWLLCLPLVKCAANFILKNHVSIHTYVHQYFWNTLRFLWIMRNG